MALPFLPGNSFKSTLGKTKHHKSHHFDYSNDVAMLVGQSKPGIGGEPIKGQVIKPRMSSFPRGETQLPNWVAFDQKVLCFDAFFHEEVIEKREEQFRVRECKIYFYLEDDSIQVIEPRAKNSGIPQGTLIRRHRINKPNSDQFYTVEDFNIDNEINLYSKIFKITNCDNFTYNFLRKLGIKISQPADIPVDPYGEYRKGMDGSMQPLRPYEKHDTLKQFLDHDRHVLRFYCYWDDSDSMFGDPREMILHYFLADDTMEMREVIPPNSGRDNVAVFLRRGKMPKDVESVQQPGVKTDRTVLNVFGPMGHGGRYILDSLKTGAIHTEFYKDSDLTIGTVINVLGRKFIICDCDEFTKEYYKSKFGIEQFTPITYKQNAGYKLDRQYPPYNGFGSEEDSLCSCMGLLPKPPKRDFIKFMEKDRHGLESNVLRFLAKLNTTKPIDMERRFIISYFLCDDTILVFEPPVRNSGIIGGKFLERGRIKKPGQPLYSTKLSDYFSAQDLYVGSSVDFSGHKFILIDADEYAFRYMEEHSAEFPLANINNIVQKIKNKIGNSMEDVRAFFARNDPHGAGAINYEQFHSLMLQIDGNLTEQEIMTIARYYSDRSGDNSIDAAKLMVVAQEQLRKRNYEDFAKLLDALQYEDKDKSGQVNAEVIRSVFHAHHVPLPDDMLRAVLTIAPGDGSGNIVYSQFIKLINWKDNPAAPIQYTATQDEGWSGTQPKNQINSVNYMAILKDIFGNID
ncbi:EF-hand domain-containing family member C2 [Patella vulgata]|uniref:EF-hand domain-containing family member C2 n=1 Tax=Patella vulgata TaxID=6465 RepID=UPI0024A7D69F|nr:EF-hand domain-containing family member C2 [Patella vulgata]